MAQGGITHVAVGPHGAGAHDLTNTNAGGGAGLAPAGYAQPMGLYAIQQGIGGFTLDAWGNPTPAGGAADPYTAFAAGPAYAAAAANQAAMAAAAGSGYLLSPQGGPAAAAIAAAAAAAAAAAGSPTSSGSLQVGWAVGGLAGMGWSRLQLPVGWLMMGCRELSSGACVWLSSQHTTSSSGAHTTTTNQHHKHQNKTKTAPQQNTTG